MMKGGFGGRQGEDQPAVAGVDGCEVEDVAKEGAVGFRIGGVEDDVGAVDHSGLLRRDYGVTVRRVSQGVGLRFVESHLSQKPRKMGHSSLRRCRPNAEGLYFLP